MADYKNNPNRRYQSNYERYQQYRNPRRHQQQSKQSTLAYRFVIQALIAGCVLMGVLVTGKLQNNPQLYENIKSSLLSAFPYGKTNQAIESLLGGFPTLNNDETSTVNGTMSDSQSVMMTLQELKDHVVIRDYLDGVIIEVEPGEPVLSLVPGVIQFKGETKDTLNTIEISLADDSILTVGFIENPQVSLYERIKVNQPLGVGTQLEGLDMSYYYLSLEVNGEVVDIIEFIDKIGSLGGSGESTSGQSDETDGFQTSDKQGETTKNESTTQQQQTDGNASAQQGQSEGSTEQSGETEGTQETE